MITQALNPNEIICFLERLLTIQKEKSLTLDLDSKKHKLILYENLEKLFELKLPLPFPKIEKLETLAEYFNRLSPSLKPYTIILIQAGKTSLGYFEDNRVKKHKTFRTYMVRKRQGKNELLYMSKGKKRNSSGGQLRYQNAIKFFEEINRKLNQWNMEHPSNRILYSCPVRMWSYIFGSKVKPYFNKKDPRIMKIPFYVNSPGYEELLKINKKISLGYFSLAENESLEKHLNRMKLFS